MSPAEVAARSGSPNHLAGVLDPSGATVQPAILVRALRRLALEQGVEIVERKDLKARPLFGSRIGMVP